VGHPATAATGYSIPPEAKIIKSVHIECPALSNKETPIRRNDSALPIIPVHLGFPFFSPTPLRRQSA